MRGNMTDNVKIISRDEFRTVINTDTMTYTISMLQDKGTELLIELTKEKEEYTASSGKSRCPFTVRLWLPEIARSTGFKRENYTELSVFPVPKEVLDDIERRTDLNLEDVANYEETERGKELFIKTPGDIVLTNI